MKIKWGKELQGSNDLFITETYLNVACHVIFHRSEHFTKFVWEKIVGIRK
jgi:hypothetical protein